MYRTSMFDLANMRRLSTQFVYLTATLPPSMTDQFYEQNHIANPRIIILLADRPNITYEIHKDQAPGLLVPKSVRFIRTTHELDLAQGAFAPKDKIIIYCRSLATTTAVAELMQCTSYTADAGTQAEKENIVSTWLNNVTTPWIVATSALGAGFDYPHIRRVWHLDAPKSMVDCAQESGQAGRDGKTAIASIILQSSSHKHLFPDQYRHGPTRNAALPHQGWNEDDGAMHQYLVTRNCLRWCMSRFLDGVNVCVLRCDEEIHAQCDNCAMKTNRAGNNPDSFDTSTPVDQSKFTGPKIHAQRLRDDESMLWRVKEDLVTLQGTCLLCGRGRGSFDHPFSHCPHRFSFFDTKKKRAQLNKGNWFKPFTACYTCGLPDIICPQLEDVLVARPDSHPESQVPSPLKRNKQCKFPDLVMPLCWAMWEQDPEDQKWFNDRLCLT